METKSIVILLAFDIPTENPKAYRTFRKNLLAEGFIMLQNSVYYRVCQDKASAKTHLNRVRRFLLAEGDFLIFSMGYKQFEKMQIYKKGKLTKTDTNWDLFEIL